MIVAPVIAVLSVDRRTRTAEFWRASGHGVEIVSRYPETNFALAAIDAGISPLRPFETRHDGAECVSMRWKTLRDAAGPAMRAREAFRRLGSADVTEPAE